MYFKFITNTYTYNEYECSEQWIYVYVTIPNPGADYSLFIAFKPISDLHR